jgi:hypothetical protein
VLKVDLIALAVVLVCMAELASAADGLPNFAIPDCLGVNIHFTGREDKQVEQIAQAGFRFVRMDFHWHTVEKSPGVYDFKAYDELVDSLAVRGIRPLFILDYGNSLYDRGLAPRTEMGRKAFAAFASAAASHFRGKGVLWEIWNEPNLGMFWRPAANPDHYVKLVEVTSQAMKKSDPDCTILAPALSGWDFDFMKKLCKLGLLRHIDAISLHPYGSSIPEDAEHYYAAIRKIVAGYQPEGRTLPLISGEWGYSSVGSFTVEKQADYLVRMFLVNLMNDIRLSIWYDWRDDGPDPNEPEHHFGTVYLDFRPKPAYLAMQTLTRELSGYTFATRLRSTADDRDFLVLFRNGEDLKLVAWTKGEGHKVLLPVDVEEFELVSMLGERRRVRAADHTLELELSGSPIYIVPMQKSRRWTLEAAWDISAKVIWKKGKQVLQIVSRIPVQGANLTVSGSGLADFVVQTKDLMSAKTGNLIETEVPYVWNGDPSPTVLVKLSGTGLAEPLQRLVSVDTSRCVRAEVLPPVGKSLIIRVTVPLSARISRAYLELDQMESVDFASTKVGFSLKPGAEQEVRIPFKDFPKGVFGFALCVRDETGFPVIYTSKKRYAVVETFVDGPPGQEVDKYACELDGDPSVEAKASLSYASYSNGADSVCARLDYDFGKGWRFVRISPRSQMPIEGKPIEAKIWVKGDGNGTCARLRFVDAANQTFQPSYGSIDFADWLCLSAPITGKMAGHWGGPNDGIVRYPIAWNTLFLLDNVGGRKKSGTVYLGSLMLVYD